MEQEVVTWFKYVPWHVLLKYLATGWRVQEVGTYCPKLDEYGTTMEWSGVGDPPVHKGDAA